MTDVSSGTRVRLGRTELSVSPICFGTWQLSPRFWGEPDEDQIIRAIHRAIDIGINFFDTADAYGDGLAESVLGRAFSGIPRDKFILATKVFWHMHPDGRRYPDLSKPYILEECDASLKRLKLSHIDLYQCHSYDQLTHPHEIADAMETLIKQGKIRAAGTSNWNVEQLRILPKRFGSEQPPYSLLKRGIEESLLPYCMANDIGTLVYSSLHLGLLSGKYKGDESFTDLRKNQPDFQGERFRTLCDRVRQVGEIGKNYGLTTVQTVIACTIMHPAITCAIVGIKQPKHIEEAAGAVGKTVSREDWYKIRGLLSL